MENIRKRPRARSKPAPKAARSPPPRRTLSVAYLELDCLKPDPLNARRHSEKQIRQIARSIEAFGFNVPILVDGDGHVIAGHGRLAAARRLALREIPVVRIEGLSEAQKRAFMIADNRLAEVAVWDDRRLGEALEALAGVELDFDLEAIGFEMREIDLRIESLHGAKRPAGSPPKTVAGGVSRAGDLWRLGPHELLCGSDPPSCDVIVRCWQADTGAIARHGVSGASFDEVAQLRAPSVIARSPCDEAIQGPRDAAPGLPRSARNDAKAAGAAGEP